MGFDDVLLGLILMKPRTGYELKKWLDVEGVFIRANADQAQIYRTLGRLLRAGFVAFRTERRVGPEAKVYYATAAGAQRVSQVLEEPYMPPARWKEADFYARLTFMILINPAGVLPMMRIELEYRRYQVQLFRSFPRSYEVESDFLAPDKALSDRLMHDVEVNSREQVDAWIAWLERTIDGWAPLISAVDRAPIRIPPSAEASARE